jgi:hypothetical protein
MSRITFHIEGEAEVDAAFDWYWEQNSLPLSASSMQLRNFKPRFAGIHATSLSSHQLFAAQFCSATLTTSFFGKLKPEFKCWSSPMQNEGQVTGQAGFKRCLRFVSGSGTHCVKNQHA